MKICFLNNLHQPADFLVMRDGDCQRLPQLLHDSADSERRVWVSQLSLELYFDPSSTRPPVAAPCPKSCTNLFRAFFEGVRVHDGELVAYLCHKLDILSLPSRACTQEGDDLSGNAPQRCDTQLHWHVDRL